MCYFHPNKHAFFRFFQPWRGGYRPPWARADVSAVGDFGPVAVGIVGPLAGAGEREGGFLSVCISCIFHVSSISCVSSISDVYHGPVADTVRWGRKRLICV